MKKDCLVTTNLILILAFVLMSPTFSFADDSSHAKVLEIKGEASFEKAGTTVWEKLDPATIFSEGDSIKTGADGEVRLELMGASKTAEILVRKETEFKFTKFRNDEASKIDNTLLDVGIGDILVKAEKLVGASKFEVKTPTSIVGIRGTIFEVHVPKAE